MHTQIIFFDNNVFIYENYSTFVSSHGICAI